MSSEHQSAGSNDDEPMIQWGKTEVALAKAALSFVPLGSFFSELLTEFIPTQRRTRIEKYLHALEQKLDGMSKDEFSKRMADPQAIDLFEEGGMQSVRALSEERLDHIALIVAKGLTGDDIQILQAKRILNILAELDDLQILMLSSHLLKNMHDDEFWEKHSDILNGTSTHLGSDQKEFEAEAIHEAARDDLKRLGLLRQQFQSVRKGELPEFDDRTGMLKGSSVELTTLGRMLLSHIGQSEPGEF